ncbi:MAG: hypothetical protein IPL65_18940 [Lewinellaceae bacterium]|nr:hypothetical protein [Lewinellaceae bacterium]
MEIDQSPAQSKETETLAGTYFQFNANGTMETNLPLGAGTPTAYELREQEIRQKSAPPVVYKILESTDSSLVIVLEMRGVNFEMHFEKDLHPDVQDTLSNTAPVDTLTEESSSSEGDDQ